MSFYQNNQSSYTNFPQPIQTRPTSTPPASVSVSVGSVAGAPVPSSSSSSSSSSSASASSRGTGDDYPPGAMSYINLNIEEYRIQDLEAFFTLPTKNYDIQDVVHKKKTMCAAVDRDYTLTAPTRTGIHAFLDQALARIVQHLLPIGSGKPVTDLPQNSLSGDNGHFLINNPARDGIKNYDPSSKSGINLDDNGAPPGTLNPLKVNTIKRAVNIDTRFRPNYYTTKSSDLQINLPTKVERAISMRLASIEIPMSFYAINSDYGNNVFKVSWMWGGVPDASSALITLPDGNYDTGTSDKTKAARLESEINAQLQASLAGDATDISGLRLRYEINPITGKSRFFQDASAGVAPVAVPFKINFTVNKAGVVLPVSENPMPLQGTLGWMLGFRSHLGEYASDGKIIGGAGGKGTDGLGNIISEGICNVQGTRYIYVAIDDFVNSSNNYFTAAFASSVMAPNIITRINVAELAQDTTVYHYAQQEGYSTELDRSRSYFGPVDIQKMRVTLFDEYGRIVNLNYMDWSMELMFECIYS
jgi:hypothetical protein